MSRSNLIAVVALVLVLAAAPAAVQGASDLCAKVVVSPRGTPTSPSLANGSLSARKVEDLTLTVYFLTAVQGDHLLELKLLTPRGHLYETLTAPISSDPAARGEREVANYPRPLPVQGLQTTTTREGTFASTSMIFPVGGTAIVANALYGRWRVDVLLDHQPITCNMTNSFVLKE
jgi:hypothetical protein